MSEAEVELHLLRETLAAKEQRIQYLEGNNAALWEALQQEVAKTGRKENKVAKARM